MLLLIDHLGFSCAFVAGASTHPHDFESYYVCCFLRVILQAPIQSSPSRTPSRGDGALRVPRVLCPLAPLDRIEFPQRDIFDPTLPVPRVGRTDEDGGIPRTISPYRARVVPPLSLPPACTGGIVAVARASAGAITNRDQHRLFRPFFH